MNVSWLSKINISTLYNESARLLHYTFGNQTEIYLTWLSPSLLYSHLVSISTEALEHIIYVCLVYLLVCLVIYKLTFLKKSANGGFWRHLKVLQIPRERLPREQVLRRVLFVTSHPDDECMFFGPLIYSMTQRVNCQVYMLCLSNGNYENLCDFRRDELWKACAELGIPASNIILIDATQLPDDPNAEWKIDAVAKLILNTVESLDIQAIVTFDRDGVSQHPNHCAVYYAAASLCLANLLPKNCKFYTLDSVNILRKYLSIFDILCTCLMSTHWCILSWKEASVIRRAMMEHETQMKWFRWLYIYFSRYMFINSMREINLSDVELEMQIHDN